MNPVILPASNAGATSFAIDSDWSLAQSTAGTVVTVADLDGTELQWQSARVPGTVAQVIEHAQCRGNLDDFDWWYRCDFQSSALTAVNLLGRVYLCLDGLATIADVWLNNELILQSNNMFVVHRVDVTALLEADNQLAICFRSLSTLLHQKHPRPAWKTKLVSHQNLRWFRTTLLGRMPSWEPKLPAVGPWREVRIECVDQLQILESKLITRLQGSTGKVGGVFICQAAEGLEIQSASLQVGTDRIPFSGISDDRASDTDLLDGQKGNSVQIVLQGDIENVAQWWPHTHGNPQLLDCELLIDSNRGQFSFNLGRRGFKAIELVETAEKLTFVVNGEAVFCRGACWSSNDIVSLAGNISTLRKSLQLARDAGMNMLRVGGTMVYESDEFYRFCDELGIMVWQDFMFASMDYPVDDPSFADAIQREVQQQLARLSAHVCITTYCGNSDVQLQAALMGASPQSWSNTFFDQQLPAWCHEHNDGVPYFPSTPCGGAMPFHLDQGLAHYYGVGAFKRPLSDIGLAGIKFASEGMGFSNIPEPITIDKVFGGDKPLMHDPRWKRVVPRDAGMGSDFEDIRDHYLEQLFKQDPIALRSVNTERYLEVSRVVSGEMLYRAFSLWRSKANPCSGGLLWFYKDLVPGPGWGLIDSDNRPKAAYYAIRRAFHSQAIFLEDRGLNGFHIHLVNEGDNERQVLVELTAYRHGHVKTLAAQKQLTLKKRANITLSADELLGYFSDMGYAYQFGPVQHEVIALRMRDAVTAELLDDDHYFPVTYTLQNRIKAELTLAVVQSNNDVFLQLTSATFLQFVRLDLNNHQPEDNYFHLAPGNTREIKLLAKNDAAGELPVSTVIKGYVEALNLLDPVKINIK